MKQLILDILPDHPPALDNFVCGANVEVLQCLHVLSCGGGEHFVYLWGEPGCGRSHLLQAVVREASLAGIDARYVAEASGLPDGDELPDLVAVDDVDRWDEPDQIRLFGLYNRLREAGGSLLAAGPRPPAQLDLRDDLATRLAWGLVYQVHGLAEPEREDALYTHALQRGFRLPREVVGYLMRRWRRDLPSLIAALDALDRYSLETQRPITVPLLKEVLDAERPAD